MLLSTIKRLKKADKTYIWDEINHKWLVATPEENVRQFCIRYLVLKLGYSLSSIGTEISVKVSGKLKQRCDILVYASNGTPYILVECKAPDVALSSEIFAQASRYNAILRAPFIFLTNGKDSMYFTTNDWVNYSKIDKLPSCL